MKAYFTVGVSGSGKSHWAKTTNKPIIERDQIRAELLEKWGFDTTNNMWLHWKFKNENLVDDIVDEKTTELIRSKQDIIFSNTNLNYRRLQNDISKMKRAGYEIEIIPMWVDFDTAVDRDKKRINSVGYQVICKQWLNWLKLPFEINGVRKYKRNDKPKCILVDIDGTVALLRNRSPYEYDKVDTDLYRIEIVELVLRYWDTHKVVFLSGRDSVCREKTKTWLQKYFPINDDQLFMRTEGDSRKDCIVKGELFWENIADNYCVDFVIDDRKQIVRYWTDIGLSVLDVGNIYEEF